MRLTLQYNKATRTFRAHGRRSFDLLAKISDGMACHVEWRLSRNGKHHSLAWVFAGLVADAINDGPGVLHDVWDADRVMEHIKLTTGVSEIYRLPTRLAEKAGCPVAIQSGSISFATMDQARFSAFFDAMLAYVQTELAPHIDQSPQWPEIEQIILRVGRGPNAHERNEEDDAK